MKIPPELSQAIKDDKLVIFVGAGLSWNLKNQQGEKLEGWDNMVLKILDDLESKGFKVDNLVGLIEDDYEPIEVLNLIECNKKFNKTKIAHFIKKFVDLSEENDFSLHKKLFQLSNKIITTNYDTAFEMEIKELRKNTAYGRKIFELSLLKDSKHPILFKLHGCYEDIDSMVLFPSQYNALYAIPTDSGKRSLKALENIIYNKSVLFIGCGMGDFQINNIFLNIKNIQGEYNQKHFIININSLDSSLSFLTHIPIDEHSEIPSIVDRLLEEKERFNQQEKDELQTLKKRLAKLEKKRKKDRKRSYTIIRFYV